MTLLTDLYKCFDFHCCVHILNVAIIPFVPKLFTGHLKCNAHLMFLLFPEDRKSIP